MAALFEIYGRHDNQVNRLSEFNKVLLCHVLDLSCLLDLLQTLLSGKQTYRIVLFAIATLWLFISRLQADLVEVVSHDLLANLVPLGIPLLKVRVIFEVV